jgi:hypothetical protein
MLAWILTKKHGGLRDDRLAAAGPETAGVKRRRKPKGK